MSKSKSYKSAPINEVLHKAINTNNIDNVRAILKDNNIDINAVDHNNVTPLELAIDQALNTDLNISIAQFLVDNGAKTDILADILIAQPNNEKLIKLVGMINIPNEDLSNI